MCILAITGAREGYGYLSISKNEDIDAVVITAIFDGRARLNDETLAPLKELNVPIYFVQGNHDGYTANAVACSKNGVIVLSNGKLTSGAAVNRTELYDSR